MWVSLAATVAFQSDPVLCEGGEHGMRIHVPVNEFSRLVISLKTIHQPSHFFVNNSSAKSFLCEQFISPVISL
jgi:hypothetical protein